MPQLHTGENLKQDFLEYIQSQVALCQTQPVLDIIQIGDDFASSKYVSIKSKLATQLGIGVNIHKYISADTSKLIDLIAQASLNKHGLIFQLPLPANLIHLVDQLDYHIDVDLLGKNSYILWQNQIYPPTIAAIDLILKDILLPQLDLLPKLSTKLDLTGKLVAVVGQGKLVGKPLLNYLTQTNCGIISINQDTLNPTVLTTKADILITAAGRPKLINREFVKPEAIIIDAATSEDSGTLSGDVNSSSLYDSNILVPSPGGIGRLTVLFLFYNLIQLQTKKIDTF